MCILIAMKAGATVPEEHLVRSCASNPDGFGWAIRRPDDNTLAIARGLDAQPMIASFLAARARHPEGEAIFHARIASVGNVSLDNTHPFPVGGSFDTVVAHNGVKLNLGDDSPSDGRSDTRVFAEYWLPGIGLASLDEDRGAWEKWADGNKLAILSVDPQLSQNLYIINEAAGHQHEGVWYSNHTYRPLSSWYFNGQSSTWENDNRCDVCNTVPTAQDWQVGTCFFCDSCLVCGRWSCDCFAPASWQEWDEVNSTILEDQRKDGFLSQRMRQALAVFGRSGVQERNK